MEGTVRVIGSRVLVIGVALVAVWGATPAEAQQNCGKPKSGIAGVFGRGADMLGRQLLGNDVSRTMNDLGIDSRNFLSSAIFCALSSAEAAKASAAQTKALDSGKTGKASKQSWASTEREGVAGGTTVTSRSVVDGQKCATTSTFITDENGEEKVVEREMCQGGDGTWAAA